MKMKLAIFFVGVIVGFFAGAFVPADTEDHRQVGFTGR